MLPTIRTYGEYSSNNYGAHALCVEMCGVTIYFSYETPVAFRAPGIGLIVRRNSWGTTTGKHLNWIDGGNKRERVSSDKFQELWEEHVEKCLAAV